MIYLENPKEEIILSPSHVINASSGYDGFSSIIAHFYPIDINDVEILVGDYINDDVTVTNGSMDTYHKRIYVV